MINILLAAALAHPEPPAPPAVDQPKGTTVVREVTIIRDKDGKEVEQSGENRRVVIRHADGKMALEDCAEGRKFETADATEKDGKKSETRIVLCGKKDGTDASYAEMLDKAAKRIAKDEQLPADVRDRVVASINAEIAKLNVSRN